MGEPDSIAPASAGDLELLRLPAGPALSPGGDAAVAVVEETATDLKGYRRSLWWFSLQSGGYNQISPDGEVSYQMAEFSPDGKHLGYLSVGETGTELRLMSVGDYSSCGLMEIEGKPTALRWTPNGRLVVVVERFPLDEMIDGYEGAPIRIDWLNYKRDGKPGFAEPLSDLWVAEMGREPKLLRTLEGRVTCLEASGSSLYFALEDRHSDEISPRSRVCRMELDEREPEVLWEALSPVEALAVGAVSGRVVVAAASSEGLYQRIPRLWLIDAKGSAEVLFASFDLACEYSVQGDSRPTGQKRFVAAVPGSDEVLFAATIEGDTALFIGDPGSASVRRLSEPGWSLVDFSLPTPDVVVATLECVTRPAELFAIGLGPAAGQRKISGFNDAWVEKTRLFGYESVDVTSPDGVALSGQLFRAGSEDKSPLLVKIHGGPHMCYGSGFDLETQIALGKGFCVLAPNLRGSSGLGSQFRSLSVGQWGLSDYQDLTAFVDSVERDDRIDGSRLYLQGGSYGGYLTNWALTRSARFKAAVSERSVSNLVSKYGTADNGFTTNLAEMAGADLFDESVSALVERSPLFFADEVSTPVLLIHGEMDYRCPIEQSEQFFIALRRLGKEVEFIRFPGESHSLSYSGRPDRRMERISIIMAWLESHDMTVRKICN